MQSILDEIEIEYHTYQFSENKQLSVISNY